MNNFITLTTTMEVRPEKEKEFVAIIKELIPGMQALKGFMGCMFFKEQEKVNSYFMSSSWESLEDANASFESDEFSLFLYALDLLKSPPELRYNQTLFTDILSVVRNRRMQPLELQESNGSDQILAEQRSL